MIKRKKIISIMTFITLASMFMVGCSNNRGQFFINHNYSSVDDFNIKDVSDIYISEEDLGAFQYIGTDNPESISKYDKLDIVSYEMVGFDKEMSSYKINILIKNNSNDTINNISGSLGVMGEFGGFSENNINIKSIGPGETNTYEILISQENLVYSVSNGEDENGEIMTSDYQHVINKAINNKSITGILEYTYDNDYSKDMLIYKALNFDGSTADINLSVQKELTKKEFDDSKSYHIDNGSYLNIVHNENTVHFDNILLENVELKLNEYFDFEVIAKFKNISNEKIESFYFEPYLNLLGYNLYSLEQYELVEINNYKNKVVEPNEEFEIKATLPINFLEVDLSILDELRELKDLDMYSNKPILVQLIENRLFSLGIDYNYKIGDNTFKDVSRVYMGNGKIGTINATEYVDDSNEEFINTVDIPNLYFNEYGDLVDENGENPKLSESEIDAIMKEYYSLLLY